MTTPNARETHPRKEHLHTDTEASANTHDHSQPHSHAHGGRGANRRRLVMVLVLTAAYTGAEVIGGIAAHSLALLADAAHMLSDVAALALSVFAATMAERPATAARPRRCRAGCSWRSPRAASW